MTGNESVLNDLLSRHQALGDGAPLEELCRDHPDLLPELRRRVAELRLREMAEQETATALPPRTGSAGTDATLHNELTFLRPPQGNDEIGRLGSFRVLSVLGRGGMGVVLLAEDPTLGRQVAIKVMKAELAARPEARTRFLREAQAAAQVDHPHVAPIHHVDEEEGTPFLVMPRLKGRSLASRLKGGQRLDPAEALRIARQMAEGLAAAHALGIVHRDVKPGNVWLKAPDDTVVLLDFGLAHVASRGDLTLDGAVLGTPQYMAPEQAEGLRVEASADLFSLGVVLYEMLTGTQPFDGPSVMAILSRLASHNPPPLASVMPDLPPALSELVAELMDKRPTHRPASAAEVVERLREIEPSLPPPGTAPRRRGTSPWAAVAVGAAALTLSALALWLLVPWKWKTRRPPGEIVQLRTMPRELPAEPVEPPRPTVLRTMPREVPPGPVLLPAPRELAEAPRVLIGDADLRLYSKADGRVGVLVGLDPRAVPAREGDQIRLEAKLNQPAYVYVLWVDPNGKVVPLYPWSPKDDILTEKLSPVPEAGPTDQVSSPQTEGRGWELDNTPGLETILVLARRTPWPKGRKLEDLIGEVVPSRFISEKENNVQTFVNGKLVAERAKDWGTGNRGPKGTKATELYDPLTPVVKRLAAEFELIQAVRFAHKKR